MIDRIEQAKGEGKMLLGYAVYFETEKRERILISEFEDLADAETIKAGANQKLKNLSLTVGSVYGYEREDGEDNDEAIVIPRFENHISFDYYTMFGFESYCEAVTEAERLLVSAIEGIRNENGIH